MKKHVTILLILALILVAGYFGVARYYETGFPFGTWINGHYVTGLSVSQVNEMLLEETPVWDFHLRFPEGEEVLTAEGMDLGFDYRKQLTNLEQMNREPLFWGRNLLFPEKYMVTPEISFDEEALREKFLSLPQVQDDMANREKEVTISRGLHGYELEDPHLHLLKTEEAFARICESIGSGASGLDLTDDDLYEDLPYSDEELERLALFEKLDDFQNTGIIYDMGDALVTLDGAITADFVNLNDEGGILLGANGKPVLDESAVEAFVDHLCEEYDTLGKERIFTATDGEVVTIEGGTYGNQLDAKAEKKYLIDALKQGIRETHIPTYKQQAFVRGKQDILDSYIEIDLTDQMMYLYLEGEKKIETPIVTGNLARKNDTPAGVDYIYYKQKNRTLRGPNYTSFVYYWMAIIRHIGIHDATWRKEFGGDIYKTQGSHGCINTPKETMAELYDMVDVGFPVVLFY
ncbi:MAG: L,D-transpeptidase/peptidoglycan binding protein [Lachnospiraceae bacterium]|nr:L,D-transpeptidase/peptidoglycan binding protein [Lachnospiraceae bacterium]